MSAENTFSESYSPCNFGLTLLCDLCDVYVVKLNNFDCTNVDSVGSAAGTSRNAPETKVFRLHMTNRNKLLN